MCSIVGSYKKEDLRQLANLNAYRGQLFWSLMTWDNGHITVDHGDGAFSDYDSLEESDGKYFILHHQAPTSTSSDRHPASYDDNYLFHNGIVKERCIESMQEKYPDEKWDTRLILINIVDNGYSCLEDIDGSFACVHATKEYLRIFRNMLSPLFIDKEKNISSTEFVNSFPVTPECVIDLNTDDHIFSFKTKDDVYFYG